MDAELEKFLTERDNKGGFKSSENISALVFYLTAEISLILHSLTNSHGRYS